jgi:hypothetical protein
MKKNFFREKLNFELLSPKAQVSIELAAAIIIVILFMLATIKVFGWLNTVMVDRQQYYQGSRVTAGTPATPGTFNYTPPALNIVGGP